MFIIILFRNKLITDYVVKWYWFLKYPHVAD